MGSNRADLMVSAWQKFCRGFLHAQYLALDIAVFDAERSSSDNVWVTANYLPNRSEFEVRVDRVRALPGYWTMIIGDIAFNYRAALDHLAWALVMENNPEQDPEAKGMRRVQFPVLSHRSEVPASFDEKLPGVPDEDRARIAARQPFDKDGGDPGHWLRVLSDMNNADKHRAVRPIVGLATGGNFDFVEQHDCDVIGTVSTLPERPTLEPGAVLGHVPVRVTGPAPALRVRPSLNLAIMVWDDVELNKWLDTTAAQTKLLLSEFSPMPNTDGWFPDPFHPGPRRNVGKS